MESTYKTEFEKVIELFCSICGELCIPYFIGGSVASGVRSEFRATNDVDIVCDFRNVDVTRFIVLCQNEFYADEVSIPKLIADKSSFNIIHKMSFVKIDVFTKLSVLEESEFNRANAILQVGSRIKAKVATSEYIILAKLRWWKNSNGILSRQLEDIAKVVLCNKDFLDFVYLKEMAGKIALLDELEKILLFS